MEKTKEFVTLKSEVLPSLVTSGVDILTITEVSAVAEGTTVDGGLALEGVLTIFENLYAIKASLCPTF